MTNRASVVAHRRCPDDLEVERRDVTKPATIRKDEAMAAGEHWGVASRHDCLCSVDESLNVLATTRTNHCVLALLRMHANSTSNLQVRYRYLYRYRIGTLNTKYLYRCNWYLY